MVKRVRLVATFKLPLIGRSQGNTGKKARAEGRNAERGGTKKAEGGNPGQVPQSLSSHDVRRGRCLWLPLLIGGGVREGRVCVRQTYTPLYPPLSEGNHKGFLTLNYTIVEVLACRLSNLLFEG